MYDGIGPAFGPIGDGHVFITDKGRQEIKPLIELALKVEEETTRLLGLSSGTKSANGFAHSSYAREFIQNFALSQLSSCQFTYDRSLLNDEHTRCDA